MRGLAVMLVALLLMTGQGVRADWSDFYRPAARAVEPGPALPAQAAPSGVCIREILRAQLRHQIPGNLLLGIGLQESGMMHEGELTIWPWTANAEGDGRYFTNPETAASWVRARQADGVASVDVGCMQVNLRWHPDAFISLEHGFDPARNVDYAARLLVGLYEQTGDWVEAAGRYHSATPEHQQAYLGRLKQNVAIANDRLDIFRALAAGDAGGITAPVAMVAAEPLPEGHFWTSWLTTRSGAADEGARSLYGREVMQPVLPAFRKMF
ncbi:lytic transglycosylase domain-containing protein [Salipiger pacificus]|nr:lytic transglycosylase domain-containing protein [Alloyangia pacifica]MCA0947501.1 lytic transglycosylase domain-containing protein [Alloyangia pacifica]